MNIAAKRKLGKLKERVGKLGSVLIAFSGGVDSAFLLSVARGVLGRKALVAVTARSETYTAQEEREARAFARALGVAHRIIVTRELDDARFRKNPHNRCYYCKSELFRRLKAMAGRYKLAAVVDGSNADDLEDYRPGAVAKKEYGVISPLQDAGLTKKEIRSLSREMGLSTWSKPAMACLASRIPYDSRISARRLNKVARAEAEVRTEFSIRGNLRVRDYGRLARIEVDKKEVGRLAPQKKLKDVLKPLGYAKVVVDPRGYRSGSMNEGLHVS